MELEELATQVKAGEPGPFWSCGKLCGGSWR